MGNETKVGDQFRLGQDEVAAIAMGLALVIENMEEIKKNPAIPWTPEARKMQKEIIQSAKSAPAKIEMVSGFECRLDSYRDGDENEFLTKQS